MKTGKTKNRIREGNPAVPVLLYVLVLLICIATVYPMYYVLFLSISAPEYAAKMNVYLVPKGFSVDAYKMLAGANVLLVANRYDEITAMTLQGTAQSEVKALQELLEHPEVYDPETVRALIRSINILPPGASVELSTGEKALVLNENEESVLRPTVVSFRDNSILDLSLPGNEDIQIVDVMKTMDNRYIFNK